MSIFIYVVVILVIIVVIPIVSEKAYNSLSIVGSKASKGKVYYLYHEMYTNDEDTGNDTDVSEYIVKPFSNEVQDIIKVEKKDKPFVTIVIDDFGYSKEEYVVRAIENLPITVAIIPFLENSLEIYSIARKNNREVLLHIPMEAYNNRNNESKYIKVGMTKEEVMEFLEKAFEEIDADGINNHMGSRATEDERIMEYVILFLSKRNKIFLDSFTTPKTVGFRKAREYNLVPFKRDLFIDNYLSEYYILDKLKELEVEANRKGYVIAIGHAREKTIRVLERWYSKNKDKYIFVKLRDIEKFVRVEM